ncbi:hypothetical protein GpartN1_g2480.t1 [Galdieria partita]|uniref:Uncharacterized protein n=1 Tax=Galdieria partita TaxID=83374 RepID=A0A9C7UP94_9RHOD|nr:hypothetical protein GpartN1_g2480.t1 [Galdieria partita]
MEVSSASFVEERQPLDRKSTFREAARHAQERIVVENFFQELRSNLAAFTANNDLLRKTLANQDSLWSLQRLDSIQSQNVELTRCIKSIYVSLSCRMTYGHIYIVLKDANKDVSRAMRNFRSLLVELITRLQDEINREERFLESSACTISMTDEDKGLCFMEEDASALFDNQCSCLIPSEECGDNFPNAETVSESRRKILFNFLQSVESNLTNVEEFLLELDRKNMGSFHTKMKWSRIARCIISVSLIFVIIVSAGLIVFRPL